MKRRGVRVNVHKVVRFNGDSTRGGAASLRKPECPAMNLLAPTNACVAKIKLRLHANATAAGGDR